MTSPFIPPYGLYREASHIVDSLEESPDFAAYNWDRLDSDCQTWICAIVKAAQERARKTSADVIRLDVVPVKLVNVPRRSEDPALAKANDNPAVFGPDQTGDAR